jgi:5-(carboxyamino)imidazole ribonucleotide mutase
MVILEPENAALAAAKIIGLSDEKIKNKVKKYQEKQRYKLIEDNNALSGCSE